MMSDITFEIHGLRELERELLQLPDKLARRSLARAASEGARMVRDYARGYAKSHGLYDTGTLVKSIRHRKKRVRDWRTTQIYGIYHASAPYRKKAGVKGTAPYGRFYEYGFRDPSGGRRHLPHVRPALDNNYGRVAGAVKNRLDREIRLIQAGRIARPR